MFEWLKFWKGRTVVFAIVVVPGLLALVFSLLPFLDRSLERTPWRRQIPLLGVYCSGCGRYDPERDGRRADARWLLR
jgi:hypothetical protein